MAQGSGITNPKPGDLLFFRFSGFSFVRLGQSIILWRRSRYDHVAVCVWDGGHQPTVIHDVRDPVGVYPWTVYLDAMRKGEITIDVWRPTMGDEYSHSTAVHRILTQWPKGTPYGFRKFFLGLLPDTRRPICSEAARRYLEERAGERMPPIDWKRRRAGLRRPGGGFITVDALTIAREEDGTKWLAYVGPLSPDPLESVSLSEHALS